MCNVDMTLVSTGKDLEFDHSPPRQCRDFEAASAWVMGRFWDYEKFTGMITLGGPHVSLDPLLLKNFFGGQKEVEGRGVESNDLVVDSS
jgi:hypothetical protein